MNENGEELDEKTEELRDLFLDVADEETVTERQEETPGSLTDERPVEERLTAVIERMRESYEFDTDRSIEEYRRLVRGFFEDETDLESAFDADEDELFRARMDLHLLREEDTEFPVELRELRERLEADESLEEIAAAFEVDEETVRRARRVQRTREQARTANDRYRDEFEELVADGDLSNRLARDAREDGLQEATEGMENDIEM
jgi:membrane-associated HD superfamily phosphohydrolase